MMQNKLDNPLFLVAANRHEKDVDSGDFPHLSKAENNLDTYTLGFCRGVYYVTDIYEKQIADLQEKLKELTQSRI